MTSKNLCFKLMKEDMKRRVWNIALLCLVLLFALVVPVVYVGGTPVLEGVTAPQWLERVTSDVLQILGGQNPLLIFIMVVGAVVSGVSGFSYLHASRKVDFYHSIPVKRKQLFLAVYFNGILMAAVIYLLNLLIACVAASTFGVDLGKILGLVIRAFVFHMAFYSLLYTTVVIAMQLTGNIIVALMGTAVFFSYGPAVIALWEGYMSTWFKTYSPPGSYYSFFGDLLGHSSPFAYYLLKIEAFGRESMTETVLITLCITVVLAIGACLLYKLRPSEAAGRAIAFPKSMMPLKILIVMPSALASCLFFYALRTAFGWAVFGLLCGALITHCLIEIIYGFDFRRLLAHKVHLIICMAAGLLILCGFKFDWIGYDTYLPKADQVQSSSICLSDLDRWITYGDVVESPVLERGYVWAYESGNDYMLDHMELSDPADVIYMAEQGIQFLKDNKNKQPDRYSDYDQDESRGDEKYVVQYTLKNGNKIRRAYTANKPDVEAVMGRLYDSKVYKDGAYPIMLQTPENTVKINVQQFDQMLPASEHMDVGGILAAYQEDLSFLTMETRKEEVPIGTIQFVTKDMDQAIKVRRQYNEGAYVGDITDRGYYPVYPSFYKTLKLLQDSGIQLTEGINEKDIVQMEIGSDYKREDEGTYVKLDKEEITELAPALIFEDYYRMNVLTERYKEGMVKVKVIMKDGTPLLCYINEKKVPEFVKKKSL